MNTPPNVLCFITDQQRADHLGCYGNPIVQSPNIDRLAAQGSTFTASYVANPLCMPNRASLFTGMFPKAHGVRENGIALNQSHAVLPDLLRQAGYQTASFGKLHLTPFAIDLHTPLDEWESYETPDYWATHTHIPMPYYGLERLYYVGGHGPYTFGQYAQEVGPEAHKLLAQAAALTPPTGAKESWQAAIPEAQHYNTRIADRTIDFLKQRDPDRPFFAWCSFPDPHHPYMLPAPYCNQYDPATIPFNPARRESELDSLPPYFRQAHNGEIRVGGLQGGAQITNEHYQEILAHTYGMITMIDANIGRVMNALEDEELLDNTIVVFMSDHGDLMGDHWLINKGPFLFQGLVRVPTIWRVPGIKQNGAQPEAIISSVDFAPTILDFASVDVPPAMQGRSYKDVLTGEQPHHRDGAYIEYDSTYLGDRLRQLRTHEWAVTAYANSDHGLLYDLKRDPDELHNLWDDASHQQIKQNLLAQLLQQATRYDSWQPTKKAHA